MIPEPILAASQWARNADLIVDVAKLGYLKKTDRIFDPTFGRGNWWKRWTPDVPMVTFSREMTDFDFDFRHVPFKDGEFDVVAYDPPYVCVGGRSTSTLGDHHARYGLTHAPKTPLLLQQLINEGMDECVRVLKPRGILLVKCQDYISSGKLHPGAYETYSHAHTELGLVLVDRFIHLSKNPRPLPEKVRMNQKHARNTFSTLFVFQKAA